MRRAHTVTTVVVSLLLIGGIVAPAAGTPTVSGDQDPPSVHILSPDDGATVEESVLVEANASDLGSGVEEVKYQVDSTSGTWTTMALDLTTGTYKEYLNTSKLSDGSHTLYVRAEDNADNTNTTSIQITVANPPAAPTGVTVTEPSAPSDGGFLDVAWEANTEDDLSHYNVYRSTSAGGPYTKLAEVPAGNTTYHDDAVQNGQTYYYVVSAEDVNGNEGSTSSEVNGTPEDTKAPELSNRNVDATPRSAEVTWDTHEEATSVVEYGTTTSLDSSVNDSTLVLEHGLTLTGLEEQTTYNYRIRSTDAAGNERVSDVYTFTTPADHQPSASVANPAEDAVVSDTFTLQANASDDWGVDTVEYAVDDGSFQQMAFNASTDYYEADVNSSTLADGAHTFTVRVTDTGGQTTTAEVNLTVDNEGPNVTPVTPDPVHHELLSNKTHTLQIDADDAGTGVQTAKWQIDLSAPYAADATAWKNLSYNAETGYWETQWTAPTVVLEKDGTLFMKATDGTGKTTTNSVLFSIAPDGREFRFENDSTDSRIRGMVTIEPIGENTTDRIGISVRGSKLTPGAEYTVEVTSGNHTETVSFVANEDGEGSATLDEDTLISDESDANITVTGPEF